MTNYTKLNYEFEVYDYFKSSEYKYRLSYNYSIDKCLLDDKEIDFKAFRRELQDKHYVVFLNGERFKYGLQMYCTSKVINDNNLDSYTLFVNDIVSKLSTEYINIKDILTKLNIHPSNYKKEEVKVSRSLKLLGYQSIKKYDKQLQKQLRVWVKENDIRQPRLPIDMVLDKVKLLSDKELDKLDKVLAYTDLSSLPDNIQELLDKYLIENNKLQQEVNKLLQTNLELANKVKQLETKDLDNSGEVEIVTTFIDPFTTED